MPYPAIGGDRSRTFHFIRALAQAGHEIHLLTFDTTTGEPSVAPELRCHLKSCRVIALPTALSALQAFLALAGRRPMQVAYYDSPRMSKALDEALARIRPDVVYTHLFRMAPYSLEAMPGHPAAWVLDLTDVISSEIRRSLPYRRGPDRWLYAVEGERIARYEKLVAPRFDRCWVICEAEARTLNSMVPGARIEVVPIGVEGNVKALAGERQEATVLFFGYQKIAHNRDAARFLAREILPRVRRTVPGAVLEIAGQGSASLGGWSRGPGIRNVGFIPNPDDAFARATVFVAPLRFGAGVQTKVLQALDAGVPVVTTPLVREGLAPLPGDVLRVGATAEEIAAHVIELIRDPREATAMGERGRAWVRGRFRWESAVRAFENAAGERNHEPALMPT
jgi:glycosyltransferase involved in cell wall biosynthesis